MRVITRLQHYFWIAIGVFFLAGCTSSTEMPLLSTLIPTAIVVIPSSSDTAATLTPTLIPLVNDATATPTAVDIASPAPIITPTPSALPTPQTYIVQEGENPSVIAAKFGADLNALLAVNGISPTTLIYVGQELIIPPAVNSNDWELPLHIVKPGETLSDIAANYGIDLESLQHANPAITPETLQIGQPLQIPISSEVHYTAPGDTLLALAIRYNTDVDALLLANPGILDLNNPDFVPVNVLLQIPQSNVATGYDCSEQAAQLQVISHTINYGEKLFCLSSKFNVSVTTLLRANPHIIGEDGVRDGVTILVPPTDGILHEVTARDVTNGIRLQDLMSWYDVTNFNDVQDWLGNPVAEPLAAGQKLFIRNADLLAGEFEMVAPIVAGAAPPPGNATNPSTGQPQPAATVSSGSSIPVSPTGDPPPGALQPKSNPWSNDASLYDAGSCGGVADGYGWSGSLIWPVDSRQIRDGRGFRPGHGAIDIEIAIDSPVYAADGGEVVWAGYSRWGGGNVVVVAHGNTWQTHYLHLNSVLVSCGQAVGKGTQIGTVGQTGASSFPHLHFEVRYGGFEYNPVNWLP